MNMSFFDFGFFLLKFFLQLWRNSLQYPKKRWKSTSFDHSSEVWWVIGAAEQKEERRWLREADNNRLYEVGHKNRPRGQEGTQEKREK